MKITFDPNKSQDAAERRGIRFNVVEGFDWATVLYGVDDRKDYGEVREVSLGLVFVVVFTRRADQIRIISARRANRKERARYAET